nr:MAG TPA: hypothetical protein [Caudoviricetes sp.]
MPNHKSDYLSPTNLLYNSYIKWLLRQSDLGAPNGRILCTFLAFL